MALGGSERTYATLASKYGRRAAGRARIALGTTTYSTITWPCCSQSRVLYLVRNASRVPAGKRSASVPSLVRKLNMCPWSDVYGIVAPLRSTPGVEATSASKRASDAA